MPKRYEIVDKLGTPALEPMATDLRRITDILFYWFGQAPRDANLIQYFAALQQKQKTPICSDLTLILSMRLIH